MIPAADRPIDNERRDAGDSEQFLDENHPPIIHAQGVHLLETNVGKGIKRRGRQAEQDAQTQISP
jgi:hypothetical protein